MCSQLGIIPGNQPFLDLVMIFSEFLENYLGKTQMRYTNHSINGVMYCASGSRFRYTNHSINGVMYCASGSRFRAELLNTFPLKSCMKHNRDHLAHGQSSSYVSGTNTFSASPTASSFQQ